MTIPIRFEPDSFFYYVKELLIDSVIKQPGKHLRAVFIIGKQETGKTWSICRMAEWIEDNLREYGTVGIKVLDVDANIKNEYRAYSLWDLTNWLETEDYDTMIAAVGEAGEFLPSMFLDKDEYHEVMKTVRRFFQARHFSKAKNIYYLFGAQVPKSFAAWIRRLVDLYVFKGLPRELAIEIVNTLKLNASDELINEIAKLYRDVFLRGRKDKAIGVSSDLSGRIYFTPPQRIINPEAVDEKWLEYLRKLREEEVNEEETKPKQHRRKHILDAVERKIRGNTVSIPKLWIELLRTDRVFVELARLEDESLAVVIKPSRHGRKFSLREIFRLHRKKYEI